MLGLAPGHLVAPLLLLVFVASAAIVGLLISCPCTQLFVRTVCRGPNGSRAIALTFDDGPDPTYTPQILDALRRADAKATFFVVGTEALAHPDLVRRIQDEGHLLASHTYSHAHTFHFWRARAMADDIERGMGALEGITGSRPAYFRPPHGLRVPTLHDALAQISPAPQCVTWTARALDTVTRSPETIVQRLTKWLIPGAILTFHDGTAFGGFRTRAGTVTALETLLAEAKHRKLACLRLDDLLSKSD